MDASKFTLVEKLAPFLPFAGCDNECCRRARLPKKASYLQGGDSVGACVGLCRRISPLSARTASPPLSQFSKSESRELIPSPNPINLGTIKRGQTARATATLQNPGSSPIHVDRVEASCPCVQVKMDHLHVTPGEDATVTVEFDPAEEPDFRGSLAVEYTGRSPDGLVVLRGRVDLRVADSSGTTGTPSNRQAEPKELCE